MLRLANFFTLLSTRIRVQHLSRVPLFPSQNPIYIHIKHTPLDYTPRLQPYYSNIFCIFTLHIHLRMPSRYTHSPLTEPPPPSPPAPLPNHTTTTTTPTSPQALLISLENWTCFSAHQGVRAHPHLFTPLALNHPIQDL